MIRLQAVGCFCYWDMHLMKPVSMSMQADIIVCVCVCLYTECSIAQAASLSPENGVRAGVGRGWEMAGDGWSARSEGRGGEAALQISSSLLWRRNQLIWQWQMNHLLFLHRQFHSLQTPFRTFSLALLSQKRLLTSSLHSLQHPTPFQTHRCWTFNLLAF